MHRWLGAILLILLLPAAARADLVASYALPGDVVMRVAVSDAGAARIETSHGEDYGLLMPDGDHLLVQRHGEGWRVMRYADIAVVMAEQFAAIMAQYGLSEEEMAKDAGFEPFAFVETGRETVAGHAGVAYGLPKPKGGLEEEMVIVVTDDPALAAVGRALAGSFLHQGEAMPLPAGLNPLGNLHALLEGRTLLRFGGIMRLSGVERRALDPAHYRAPAAPLALEAVRAALRRP